MDFSTPTKAFDLPNGQFAEAPDLLSMIRLATWKPGDGKQTFVVQEEEVRPDALLSETHIKSSPYDDPQNFLDVAGLSTLDRLFAIVLTRFEALRQDYATAPCMPSFNFDQVFRYLRELCAIEGVIFQRQTYCVVIFRSKLQPGADRNSLTELDQMSHQEACASGGLLKYWFGSPDAEMRNLATCECRTKVTIISLLT